MNYNLEISQQTIQTALQGLGELPLKISINAFMELQQKVALADTQRNSQPPDPQISAEE